MIGKPGDVMLSPEARERIREHARGLGFDAVGFASTVADPADRHNLQQYVAERRHGDMDWLARTADRRVDPRALWPEARSVIVTAMNYAAAEPPRTGLVTADTGIVSIYARGRDYHDVMRRRLKALAAWLVAALGGEAKVFVDTAPVMEKPLAMRAGLGWIGKHTNLVSRRFGSWLFLGEVFTTLSLPSDPPAVDHCGSCDRCLRACPTAALPAAYRIDPRRCVSYLTIEHKQAIPQELRAPMGNRVFGCDDCLAVCPWNAFSEPTSHAELDADAAATRLPLRELAGLEDGAFRRRFAGSSIKRTGRDRFLRNVLTALANVGDIDHATEVEGLERDPSDLVREAARWAHARLTLRSRSRREDPDR